MSRGIYNINVVKVMIERMSTFPNAVSIFVQRVCGRDTFHSKVKTLHGFPSLSCHLVDILETSQNRFTPYICNS